MPPRREAPTPVILVLVFVLLLIGIGLVDYVFYRDQVEEAQSQSRQQLAAIADMKVQQIESWRRERLGDARLAQENPLLEATIGGWLKDGLHERKSSASPPGCRVLSAISITATRCSSTPGVKSSRPPIRHSPRVKVPER